MNQKYLGVLKEQIEKIGTLGAYDAWGPEFKIWLNTTEKLVKECLGEEYLLMFQKLRNVVFGSKGFNHSKYLEELDKRKRFLEGAIAECERLEQVDLSYLGKDFGLEDYHLHPSIAAVSKEKFVKKEYADAVRSAFVEVISRLKKYVHEKTDEELDGRAAVDRAFDFEKYPEIPIKFNNLVTEEEENEQKGIMNLFRGIVQIRNRKSHENIKLDNPYRAVEYLALASLLMRLLDEYAT